MDRIGSVAVFCASSHPANSIISDRAAELGRRLAERRITLVYGGGSRGIMGTLALDLLPYVRYLVNKRPGLATQRRTSGETEFSLARYEAQVNAMLTNPA